MWFRTVVWKLGREGRVRHSSRVRPVSQEGAVAGVSGWVVELAPLRAVGYLAEAGTIRGSRTLGLKMLRSRCSCVWGPSTAALEKSFHSSEGCQLGH